MSISRPHRRPALDEHVVYSCLCEAHSQTFYILSLVTSDVSLQLFGNSLL